jgi:4'-phosphopantetheinyl transferase EntD
VIFERDLPLGRLVGVALPTSDASLVDEERAFARDLAEARRATWVGGRVALRAAIAHLGVSAGSVLATPRGAPALPAGVVGSIAHKDTLAVALAARDEGATLGVDVELDRAPRVDVSGRVLGDAERARLDALAPDARPRELLTVFAAKEAIYKALDPWLGRFIAFKEVETSRADGELAAVFAPREGEPAFSLELVEVPLEGLVLVAARARRLF